MRQEKRSVVSFVRQVNPKAYVNAAVNYCEGLLRLPSPKSYPVNLDIVLTKACNLRCTFCVSYGSLSGEHWMSFDLYERIAETLFPKACAVFICSGGEPFLYPRLRDALKLARRYKTRTTMTSNGMLMNRKAADWLVGDQSLHELCISFDGSRKETLERIRRGANYDLIFSNIERLTALKKRRKAEYPRLWFRFVIMKSNAHELPEMFEICSRLGLYKVVVKYLNVTNDIDFDESLYNHPALAAEVFAEARRRAAEHGVRAELPPLPGRDRSSRRCLNPWQFIQIDTDGFLRFCYNCWRQRIGNFRDGFTSVWRGEDYRRLRSTVDSDDPYYPYCSYCVVRNGYNCESSHFQKLHQEAYVISGLEKWQTPFNERIEENVLSLREVAKD
ncbi:MAG: radical SAM protein [Desulfomonilaceae bacterium]|nr:radical SAM protein [Desulfomonilaceae bacterium]